MRILIWNIWHGGSSRRVPGLSRAIAEIDPDIAILTEFRPEESRELSQRLGDGWPHSLVSGADPNQNGVAVFSRTLLALGTLVPPAGCVNGWLHARHTASGLEILGLYIPAGTDGRPSRLAKEVFWCRLLEAQRSLRDRPAIVAGDFNTGLWGVDMESRRVPGSSSFAELSRQGWIDAFREVHGDAVDRSWWSQTGAAFRIDHAFVSPVLRDRLRRADYLRRTTSERLVSAPGDPDGSGAARGVLSDHAALFVELADPIDAHSRPS